jgi:hypothetical protein
MTDFDKNAINITHIPSSKVRPPSSSRDIKLFNEDGKIKTIGFDGKVAELVPEQPPQVTLEGALNGEEISYVVKVPNAIVHTNKLRNEVASALKNKVDIASYNENIKKLLEEINKIDQKQVPESVALIKSLRVEISNLLNLKLDKATYEENLGRILEEINKVDQKQKHIDGFLQLTSSDSKLLESHLKLLEQLNNLKGLVDTLLPNYNEVTKLVESVKDKSKVKLEIGELSFGKIPGASISLGDQDIQKLNIIFPEINKQHIQQISGIGPRALSELADVVVGGIRVGQSIIWDGKNWIPGSSGGGDLTINHVSFVNGNLDLLGAGSIEIIPLSGGKIRIQLYVPIAITSFTGGVTREIGDTVASTTLNWTLSKSETSQSINQGIGTILNGLRSYLYSTPITSNTTFTLSVSDGTTNPTASTTTSFLSRRYYGASSSSGVLSSSDILALSNSELASDRSKNTTTNCTGGNRVVMAYPTSFGLATVKDGNGFVFQDWANTSGGSSPTPYVVSITNSFGYTQNYYVYQSFNFYNSASVVFNFN